MGVLGLLGCVAEARGKLALAAVSQVRNLASNRQPSLGPRAEGGVVAIVPVGVAGDGGNLGGLGTNLVSTGHGRSRQQQSAAHALGVSHRPLQRAHAAHRAPDDAGKRLDAEVVGQLALDLDLIAHRPARPAAAPRITVGRRAGRASRPATATEHIGTHDEPAVGVQRQPRPDDGIPPARRRLIGARGACHMGIASQCVLDQHCVAACERAIGLECHRDIRQVAAELEVNRANTCIAASRLRHPALRRGRSLLGSRHD